MSSTAEPVQNRRSIAATAPLGSRTRTAPSARRVDVASSRACGRDQSSQRPGSSLTWAGVRIDSSDCVLRKYRSAGSNKPLRAPRSSPSREGLNAVPTKKPYSPSTVRYGTFNVQVRHGVQRELCQSQTDLEESRRGTPRSSARLTPIVSRDWHAAGTRDRRSEHATSADGTLLHTPRR